MSELTKCQFCTRILTPSIRVYSCFANSCADCIDRRLANDPDVALDRELQARLERDDLPVHRVELTPEQRKQIESRDRQKSIDFDPLWTAITREDVLFILEVWSSYSMGSRVFLIDAMHRTLEQNWRHRPAPEGAPQ